MISKEIVRTSLQSLNAESGIAHLSLTKGRFGSLATTHLTTSKLAQMKRKKVKRNYQKERKTLS
jgi:hypothetical protein